MKTQKSFTARFPPKKTKLYHIYQEGRRQPDFRKSQSHCPHKHRLEKLSVLDFDATVDFSWSLRLKEGDAAVCGGKHSNETLSQTEQTWRILFLW